MIKLKSLSEKCVIVGLLLIFAAGVFGYAEIMHHRLIEGKIILTDNSAEAEIEKLERLKYLFVGLLIVAAIVSIILINKNFLRPMRLLKSAADNIAAGNLDARVNIKTTDEVGSLAESFNHMAESLKAAFIQISVDENKLKKHLKEVIALAEASNVVLTAITPFSRENFYENICDIAVKKFGIQMAWLGLIDKDDLSVKPVGYAGFEDGYLSDIQISVKDCPTGAGPTGMAIRTKKPRTAQDIGADPDFLPWKDAAIKRGYRSSMALPLISADNEVVGTINVYSKEPYFFTKERMEIFQVFANQAAVSIENKRLIEGLEEMVMQRTKELHKAKIKAEEATKAKSDFIASMNHELRAPLNSIIGFSELIRDGVGDMTVSQQKEYAGYIISSGNHLLSLINDILDLSKIESGKIELNPVSFNLKEMLESSIVMFREKAMKHNIKLSLEIMPEANISIEADMRKLKQIMFNLLSNAVKFTHDGGSVSVQARKVSNQTTSNGDFIEISVADTGIGIKPEDMNMLFKEFYRIENDYTKTYEGTGLGLALTKRMVELHSGSIGVESEFGKGSRFAFIIPVKQKLREQ